MSLPDSHKDHPEPSRAPRPFSLDSFRRQTSTNPSTPLSSPSTRPPPPLSHARNTPTPGQNIAKINSHASHAIRAAHTILDPAAIIKELIENALDARATRVDVRVRGKGALDTITISDNGCAISATDYHSLCLPSTTSKISSFGDLDMLTTFGFRGEALSAICAIAKSTTVTTRTVHDPVATALTYSNDGALASRTAAARPVGTTVQVESVFHVLPVRRKDAIKNHTREVSRCVAVVQALALISVNTRIELKIGGEVKVANLPAMRDPKVIPSSLGMVCLSALRYNAKSVLGARTANALVEISSDRAAVVKIPPSARAVIRTDVHIASENGFDTTAPYGCHGLISKASLDANGSGGRARSSYQYIYVNRRPVDFPRLTRMIKELYRRATGMNGAAPVVILNLVLPAWSCDVNLAPDKRVVCVHEEDTLISGILSLLEDLWNPTKATTIPIQKDSNLTYMIQPSLGPDSEDKDPLQPAVDLEMVAIEDETAIRDEPAVGDGAAIRDERAVPDGPAIPDETAIPDEPVIPDELAVEDITDQTNANRDLEDDVRPESDEKVDADDNVSLDMPNPSSHQGHDSTNSTEDATQEGEAADAAEGTPDPSQREPLTASLDAHLLSFSPPPAERKQATVVGTRASVRGAPYRRRSRESLILASTKSSSTRNVSSFIARRSRSLVPAKRPRSAKFTPVTHHFARDERSAEKVEDGEQFHDEEPSPAPIDVQTETVFDEPSNETESPEAVPVVDVDWDTVCENMRGGCGNGEKSQDSAKAAEGQAFKDATLGDLDNEIVNDAHHKAAENEMSRLFHQQWFNDFEILGQFNRGFIIARLRNDLFIIDQHASDEKYNFEDLQRNTVISKQRLVQPLGLEFSAQDELLVAQHLSAFRAGGFDIEYREQNPPTRRLFLKAQPISKHTIFVQDDLRDIVDMLKSSVVQSSSMKIKLLRPPRVRAMFASRACRKSIMIGTALQKPQMRKVVRNLATLEHPWTCPHGRPTMRHLCSLPT